MQKAPQNRARGSPLRRMFSPPFRTPCFRNVLTKRPCEENKAIASGLPDERILAEQRGESGGWHWFANYHPGQGPIQRMTKFNPDRRSPNITTPAMRPVRTNTM